MPASEAIVSMTPVHLCVPLPRPLRTATFEMRAVDTCCVTLRTKGGRKGRGWCFAFGPERARAMMAMARDLFATLLGRDPADAAANWEAMRKAATFVGRDGVSAMAMSALDTACWDLAAQAAGQPLWRFIGGRRREIPCYASEGLWLNMRIAELEEEAASLKARGFRGMKLRVGGGSLDADVERIRAVRAAIGGEVALMVDANQAWDVETAKRACRAFAPFDLRWVEEPVDHEDVRGCAEVARASEIPICTGETNYNPRGMRRLLAAGAADILMPDLARCSGVTGWRRAAAIAREFGKPVTPHLFHEVSAHLLSAEPHGVWCEHMPWWERILREPMALRDGNLVLSERPGLGIEWDEAAFREFAPPVGGSL